MDPRVAALDAMIHPTAAPAGYTGPVNPEWTALMAAINDPNETRTRNQIETALALQTAQQNMADIQATQDNQRLAYEEGLARAAARPTYNDYNSVMQKMYGRVNPYSSEGDTDVDRFRADAQQRTYGFGDKQVNQFLSGYYDSNPRLLNNYLKYVDYALNTPAPIDPRTGEVGAFNNQPGWGMQNAQSVYEKMNDLVNRGIITEDNPYYSTYTGLQSYLQNPDQYVNYSLNAATPVDAGSGATVTPTAPTQSGYSWVGSLPDSMFRSVTPEGLQQIATSRGIPLEELNTYQQYIQSGQSPFMNFNMWNNTNNGTSPGMVVIPAADYGMVSGGPPAGSSPGANSTTSGTNTNQTFSFTDDQVSNEINRLLSGGASWEEIYFDAQRYGIPIDQLSRVTGYDQNTITQFGQDSGLGPMSTDSYNYDPGMAGTAYANFNSQQSNPVNITVTSTGTNTSYDPVVFNADTDYADPTSYGPFQDPNLNMTGTGGNTTTTGGSGAVTDTSSSGTTTTTTTTGGTTVGTSAGANSTGSAGNATANSGNAGAGNSGTNTFGSNQTGLLSNIGWNTPNFGFASGGLAQVNNPANPMGRIRLLRDSYDTPQQAVSDYLQGREPAVSLMQGPNDPILIYAFGDRGRRVEGPGDGMSDSIGTSIDGREPAALSDGEYVVPADAVSHLGNGSTEAGAQRLDQLVQGVRQARTGRPEQAPPVNADAMLQGMV